MAIGVKADIINGVQAHLTDTGWELRSKATVYGLTATGSGVARILAGMAALAVAVPVPIIPFTGHPDLLTAILEDVTPRAQAPDTIEYDLVWRQHFGGPSNSGLIEVGASIVEEQTNCDITGKALSVTYTGTKNTDPADAAIAQTGIVPVPRAQPTIVITRQETGSPGTTAETYVGCCCTGAWSRDSTATARSTLCTAIRGISRDGGNTYQVTYQFQKKLVIPAVSGSGTWDTRLVWIDPKTGRPPTDVETIGGGAVLVAQVIPSIDFNGLSL